MKKLLMAAALLVAGSRAAEAVTYAFHGMNGTNVSGTLTIDDSVLPTGQTAPIDYVYDSLYGGNVASSFASISFDAGGDAPALFATGDALQELQANGQGGIQLDIDYSVGSTLSAFSLTRQDAVLGANAAGVLLPNFTDGGTFDYYSQTGDALNPTVSYGSIIFSELGVGGVPETSTWMMLVIGFGFTGAAIRRRRPALAA